MRKLIPILATVALACYSLSSVAAGDPAAGQQKSATCAACHGADGNSSDPANPKLAGQSEGYLFKQLWEFKEGIRQNAVMAGMVAALSEQDMRDLAAFYAAQTIQGGAADPELADRGEVLYRGGDLARGIPACAACHGATGLGNPAAKFPALGGQHAQYTRSQLEQFRSMLRATDAGQMMRNIAIKMTDPDMEAVASYIEGLRPE
jgi:cytochrome c553